MQIDEHTSISVFTSGREDDHPFVGLRFVSTWGGKVVMSLPSFSLEQAERLIQEIQEAQAYVNEFEAQRNKPRAMSGR
jgi:hypothetical protein